MSAAHSSHLRPGTGAFERVLDAERLANARRLNLLRVIVVGAFLILEQIPWIPRLQSMGTGSMALLSTYALLSLAMLLGSRRSEKIARLSLLAIPFLDMPLVFVIQRLNLEFSDSPRAVGNFTIAVFLCQILLAALSIDRRQIALAATMACALEARLQILAGEKLYGILAGAMLLLTAAAICEFARGRRIEMVWTLCREQLGRERLGRYFSPEVARAIEKTADGATGAHLCTVTVLFSDLRDFTALAEKMDTPAIVKLLNDYFEHMVAVVFEHEGTLDKYIGDGLMVYFGAPVIQEDHAARALRCALAMQRRLEQFNAATAAGPPLRMGIGIHTGSAVVGSIGASHRREYTAIGDTVNVAARIEQLCKSLGQSILVSGETARLANGVTPLRAVSEATVKGRGAPVQVFTPA